MATFEYPPTSPAVPFLGGWSAVRPKTNTEPNSASIAWGNVLRLDVLDVLSGEPLRYGGYIKSCKINDGGEESEYICTDANRYPKASRVVADYGGDVNWQTHRFYRYVSSALKRLHRRDEEVIRYSNSGLRTQMKAFYNDWKGLTGDDVVSDMAVIEGTGDHVGSESIEDGLEQALAGRDHVDEVGSIYIGLPESLRRKTITVRIEFHDIKFVPDEKFVDCFKATATSVPVDSIVPRLMRLHGVFPDVFYDRDAAGDLEGGADPDKAGQESTHEESNWKLRLRSSATAITPFRNFYEFRLTLEAGHNCLERAVYPLTWCQPVWHVSPAFYRRGRERSTFGKSQNNVSLPMINTQINGSSENYGVFGIFRTRDIDPGEDDASTPAVVENQDLRYRLHGGIDIAGFSRSTTALDRNQRTPVFAVHSGRADSWSSGTVMIYHRDKQVLQYVHMYQSDHFVDDGQWVKAGSLIGKMGRRKIPSFSPTHVHFETRIHKSSGHAINDNSELTDADAIDWIRSDNVPSHEDVILKDHIKSQYGKWLRRHDLMWDEWVSQQIGTNGIRYYSDYLPQSEGNWFIPPCQGEFASDSDANALRHPFRCTCSCRAATGAAESGQVRFAKKCWAIKTTTNPHQVPCPGLSTNGPDECFTDEQRIQYHLWQLGYYKSFIDGALGNGSAAKLLEFYQDYNHAEVLNQKSWKPEDRTVGSNGLQSTIVATQNAETDEWSYRTKKQIVTALKAANDPDLPQIIDDLKTKLDDDMKW